jgi:hypothetical protein
LKNEGYTKEELNSIDPSGFPTRGPLCPSCGARIPVFLELSEEDENRLKALADEHVFHAMFEVRRLTGCPLGWAKIWAFHPHGPKGKEPPAPCPFCAAGLRTKDAKQCRHCKRDWHDPENVTLLGGNKSV